MNSCRFYSVCVGVVVHLSCTHLTFSHLTCNITIHQFHINLSEGHERFDLCIERRSDKAGVTDITPLDNLIMGKRHMMGVSHDMPCRKQVSQKDNKRAHDCGDDRI